MKLYNISEGILYEGGMSRILAHYNTNPFVMLTAFRGNNSLSQNRRLNRQMESEFKSIGAGALKCLGHSLEAPDGVWYGHNSHDINRDTLDDVSEETYFIPMPPKLTPEEFRAWAVSILIKFHQDAAVYSDGSAIYLLDKLNELVMIGNKITIDKIAQAYSAINGKNFVFEGTMRPTNNIHRQLLRTRSIFWV